MKSVDTIARVRRAFHVQGWSLKRISRELHLSRNTIRKILRSDETSFSYERERQPKPKISIMVSKSLGQVSTVAVPVSDGV